MSAFTRLREAATGSGGSRQEMGVREQLKAANIMADHFQENLARLEDTLEQGEWRRISANIEREFTRPGLDAICELSRALYLSHPLIKRAVDVTTYYTFAQGVTFKAVEDRVQNEVIDPQTADDGNRAELYGHHARILTDVDQLVEGNTFMALFTDLEGNVQIRSFPTRQIRQIYHLKGDSRVITFYHRQWTEQYFDEERGTIREIQQECLYPDWRYHPKNKPEKAGRLAIRWDAPIIHKRSGGLKDMMFGVPETYAAMDWARAYRKFLENWHTLVASLAKFAWNATTKGSKIKAGKEKLRSHLEESDTFVDDNETVPGGVFLGKAGDKMEAIPKSGAHTSAEDARPSRLMVASAMGLPDTILSGDVDVGNFATSKTLDRPTWLKMRTRQFTERDYHQDIFRYSIDAKIRAGKLPGKVIWTPGDLSYIEPGFDSEVKVTFPPILREDTVDMVKAIIAAATLEGKAEAGTIPPELTSKMLMETLEVEDIDAVMEELDAEERQDLQQTVNDLQSALAAAQKQPQKEPEPSA